MRRSVHRCAGVLAAVLALGACSGKRAKSEPAPGPTTDQAAVVASEPETGVVPAVGANGSEERKAKLRLTLRSTPPGATASVDGRQVGQTPLVHEIEADGRVHEFTFVLANHSLERYRFPPVRDGVVHATLKPIPPDAGPP